MLSLDKLSVRGSTEERDAKNGAVGLGGDTKDRMPLSKDDSFAELREEVVEVAWQIHP